MPSIVVGVEADQVTVQDTEKNLVPYRQDTVDLRARERCVQEESEFDVLLRSTNLLPQHGREQHQVVVMHPNQVVILHICRHSLGEQPVGFSVCLPGALVESNFTGVVMEEGPEDRICRQVRRWASADWSSDLMGVLLEKPL